MPYADPVTQKKAQQSYYYRRKSERLAAQLRPPAVTAVANYDKVEGNEWVQAWQTWAEAMIVPTGSRDTIGKPFIIHDYQLEFARLYADPNLNVAICSIPRKMAKTATTASFVTYDLLHGPEYWAGAVASINYELTTEVKKAIQALVSVNGELVGRNTWRIDGQEVTIYRSKDKGVVCGTRSLEFLAADKRSGGHGKSLDVVVFDELGRTNEDDREMLTALLAALGIKDGKLVGISPRYDSPLMAEYRQQANDSPYVDYVEYAADIDDDPYDKATWYKANPGLGTIFPFSAMEKAAEIAKQSDANKPFFLAQHLNMPLNPEKITIVQVHEWLGIYNKDKLENEAVYLGVDLGGSASMSCVSAIGSQSGQMQVWGAWPGYRSIEERARADSVGNRYQKMLDIRELRLYSGRLVPVGQFLRDVFKELIENGCTILEIGADRYRDTEMLQMLDDEGWYHIPVNFRPVGGGKDGSFDIRAFQESVLLRRIGCNYSLLMESAIASSKIKVVNGNPSLEKVAANSRIDALSAAVLAVGIWKRNFSDNIQESSFKIWT